MQRTKLQCIYSNFFRSGKTFMLFKSITKLGNESKEIPHLPVQDFQHIFPCVTAKSTNKTAKISKVDILAIVSR